MPEKLLARLVVLGVMLESILVLTESLLVLTVAPICSATSAIAILRCRGLS